MSNSKLLNMIKIQASLVNNSRTMTAIGIVTAYNPENYLVQVQIYPQDGDEPALQTGWIPLFTPWMGQGWGLFLPPNIGDIIEVHYQEGSLQNAYAGLRSFNFNDRPLNVSSGEFWLVHQTGSFIKLTNDGNLSISSEVEINITAPIVNVNSPEVNLGSGTLGALLAATAATVFDNHVHPTPSGLSSPPTTSMSSDVTSNTKAS